MNKENSNVLPQADAERLNAYFPREDWNLYFWGFTCFSRQDYARTVSLDGVDEIMLGVQCIEGGCLSEMVVRWFMLDNKPATGWRYLTRRGRCSRRPPLQRSWRN